MCSAVSQGEVVSRGPRTIRPPSPWRYAVLVSGESGAWSPEPSLGRPGVMTSPYRRVRILDVPAAAMGAVADAMRFVGVVAQVSDPLPVPGGRSKVTDGFFAGPQHLILGAMSRIVSAHRELAASIVHALEAYSSVRPHSWFCSDQRIDFRRGAAVMGILNMTPDSFSGDGLLQETIDSSRGCVDPGLAEDLASGMFEDGASIIDVGGESTRPSSSAICAEDELRRIIPLLDRIAGRYPVPISVDTSKALVAREAIARGVRIINDVTALRGDPEMLSVIASSKVGVVLMHMRGTPATMQSQTSYEDLLRDVFLALHTRVRDCLDAGIDPRRIAVDPGLGFAKTAEHNLALLRRCKELTSLGMPVLVGPSRKGFLGRILNLPAEDRVEGTTACCVAAAMGGASILRVHDVKAAVRALKVAAAIETESIDVCGDNH